MAVNTLITIQDKLREFAQGHAQIQRIFFGGEDKRAPLLTDAELFPALYVAPIDVLLGRAHNTHRLRIYVYERLDSGASDEWENANDTSLILRDIRVWWNDYGTDDIFIESDPTGTFKTDAELDNLVGYYADFLFQIPSHGRCDVPVNITPTPTPSCNPATVNIEINGDLEITEEIPSGNSETISLTIQNTASTQVGVVSGDTVTVPDSTANVQVNGTPAFLESIPSGVTETIALIVENTASTQVGSVSGSTITAPNATTNIQFNGVTQKTVSVPSGASQNDNTNIVNTSGAQVGTFASGQITVPNATANIQVLGVTKQTVSIASGATSNIQALPNVPEFGIRKSGQTLISLPNDAVNNLLGIGADWWNLRATPNNINCFGNYKRFTNVTGNYQEESTGTYFNAAGVALGTQTFAAAFPSGIIIDWFSRFPSADGTKMFVYGWAVNSISGTLNRLAAANYCNALTVGGYSVWKLPKKTNFDMLANESITNLSGYMPLSSSGAAFGQFFWTEDSYSSTNPASRYTLGASGTPWARGRDPLELTNRALPIRIFEIVGNTLI